MDAKEAVSAGEAKEEEVEEKFVENYELLQQVRSFFPCCPQKISSTLVFSTQCAMFVALQ